METAAIILMGVLVGAVFGMLAIVRSLLRMFGECIDGFGVAGAECEEAGEE